MHWIFTALQKRWGLSLILVIVVLGIIFLSYGSTNGSAHWVTATVEEGTVSRITSVSGTLKATQTARLAFPMNGTIEAIRVAEGYTVSEGDEIAVLFHNDLKAEYESAQAAFTIAKANYDELVNGLRPEERAVAETRVKIAEEELIRITREYDERVENAYRTLLSSNLVARPVKKDANGTAPTVGGTYTCAEGTYTLSLFRSNADSGYSYHLRGLETGSGAAYTDSPAPLGTCGLTLQFADENYTEAEWTITIPNTESASYVTNLNAYNLARTTRTNAIRAAEQDLELAQRSDTLDTATPRPEALARAEAQVRQATAHIETVRAQIEDHVLTAPFSGVITRIDSVTGESANGEPVITMVSDQAFELTALIPEIDVTRVTVGQKARVIFDARQEETLEATVLRVSPLAREINGVSYFEAALALTTPVDWLRGGLNADIDIILDTRESVLRIPKRFLIEEAGNTSVLVPNGKETKSLPVSVKFSGNDGFVEIEGLTRGDTVIAP